MAKRPAQSLAFPLTAHQVEVLNSMLETLYRKTNVAAAAEFTGVLEVEHGGSGRATALPYSVITGGISTTGEHQSVASVGTLNQVLTSNGDGAMPTWEDVIAALEDLTDVFITAPQEGDILVYHEAGDSDPAGWYNEQPVLDDLTDVTVTAPADGDILVYRDAGDSDPAGWYNEPNTGGFIEWSVLTDGDLVDPQLIFAGGDVIMVHTP